MRPADRKPASVTFGVVDRYVCRTVLYAIGAVVVALMGLLSIFALLEELPEEGASYTLLEAVWYVALTLPRRAYEILPYVVFLGSLIGLGHLANQSELVVLRAAGISVYRLFGGLAWAAVSVLLVGIAIGEFVAPAAETAAEVRKAKLLGGSSDNPIQVGHWYREGSLYMRVSALSGDGQLLGVSQYWLDENEQLVHSRTAARAEYVAGPDAHWLLHDGAETFIRGFETDVREFAEVRWNTRSDPRLLSTRVLIDPKKLSMVDLYYQIDYMQREGLNTRPYLLAYWGKIMQPAAVLGLALLALSFILGPLREVAIGVRLTAGIVVGLSFKYLQDLFAPMSIVYDLPPQIAVIVPIVLCWVLGIVGIRRVA